LVGSSLIVTLLLEVEKNENSKFEVSVLLFQFTLKANMQMKSDVGCCQIPTLAGAPVLREE
jgi:hypothetical protein